MANLKVHCRDTLLLAANPNLTPLDEPSFSPRKVDPGSKEIEPHKRRIWNYSFSPGTLTEVTNLTVCHRMMNNMVMPVCDKIEWGPVSVSYQGKPYEKLPLTKDYLVASYFLDGGANCEEGVIKEGASRLWPLPANLQSSYQLVFAYEMSRDRTNTQWQKPSEKTLSKPSFIETLYCNKTLPYTSSSGPDYTAVNVQLVPLRVVVVLTLGLCTERDDFTPGNELGSARVYPLIGVMSNLALDWAEGSVTIVRPAETDPAMRNMDEEQMSETYHAELFSDRNGSHSKIPEWDNFFDYYLIDPPVGEAFAAVKCGAADRTIEKGTFVLRDLGDDYWQRPVIKMARQGEFDNIHLAPKMRAAQKYIDRYPEWGFDNIAMAPFCVHDCLHTHWRWGSNATNRSNWGWSGTAESPGLPYAEPGAPMVPPNQNVAIKILGPNSFQYTAKIATPKPCKWQIIMHHGSAYGISVSRDKLVRSARAGEALMSEIGAQSLFEWSWSLFYWHLRYWGVDRSEKVVRGLYLPPVRKVRERLRIDAQTLGRLREG